MRKCWLALSVVAGLMIAGSLSASAQTTAPRIAVMNLQTVMAESIAGKQANAELAQFVQAKQAEVDELNARVDALQEELANSNLSAPDREAKQAELDSLIDRLQELVVQAQNEVNAFQQQLRNRVLNDIGQVLSIIGQERDYSLILDSSAVFYYKLVVDITWEVVRRYDELYEAAVQAAQLRTAPSSAPANP